VIRYRDRDRLLGTVLLGDKVGVVRDFRLLDVLTTNVTPQAFDADLRMYLRQPAEYRLTDAAGTPLNDWTAYPQDATPLMSLAGIARTVDDDYEFYVERRIGDQIKRFQVPFKLEPERTERVIDTVDVDPVIVDTPDVDRVIVDDPDGERVRVKKTIRTIRRPASGGGAAVIRNSDGSLAASSPGTPGPGSPAPGSPAPGSPAPGPPAPGSPAPAPGQPAPPNPANPNAKPTPGSPAPPGSDTRAPSAYPADVAQGSDSRAPVQGSATRAGANPGAAGSATRGSVTGKPASGSSGSSRSSDDDKKKSSGLLDALKNYNRD